MIVGIKKPKQISDYTSVPYKSKSASLRILLIHKLSIAEIQ